MRLSMSSCAFGFVVLLVACPLLSADDQPQWGERHSRNLVSSETGLPARVDLENGSNIKWTAPLGTDSYGTPSIANGKVLVGANNARPLDPKHQGDQGVLLCLDEADGKVNWQLVVPRISDDIYKDWPRISLCSPPTIDGDRVYTLTNRFEVVCLDINGLADGNDGAFVDEARHMTPAERPALELGELDADIVWLYDMVAEVDVYPHDATHSSILLDGDFLYINTCNGMDNTHRNAPSPDAPSLIVLDKNTGKLIARDREGIGARIFHSTWSSPAMGEVNGEKLVFFAGGDSFVYAFPAVTPEDKDRAPFDLEPVWRFDCDPTAPKEDIHSYKRNREVGPSNINSMPVFHDGRVYVTYGGDVWWGKDKAWLVCIDPSQEGDVTDSARVWTYPLTGRCCTTPSIYNGMAFVADCRGTLHCVDIETGDALWTADIEGDCWGSTLVADGKVYVPTRRRDVWVFAAEKERRLISRNRFDDGIATSPVAANGVLYIATKETLYAIEDAGEQ